MSHRQSIFFSFHKGLRMFCVSLAVQIFSLSPSLHSDIPVSFLISSTVTWDFSIPVLPPASAPPPRSPSPRWAPSPLCSSSPASLSVSVRSYWQIEWNSQAQETKRRENPGAVRAHCACVLPGLIALPQGLGRGEQCWWGRWEAPSHF